ncbi:unnamed protein product [Closterium sp. NIES-54]
MEEQYCMQSEELIGTSTAMKASATSGNASWETGHSRLAHVAVSTLELMHKEKWVHSLQVHGNGAAFGGCKACMQNKFVRFLFPRAEASAKAPLEVVHMDLAGPMWTEGLGDHCTSSPWWTNGADSHGLAPCPNRVMPLQQSKRIGCLAADG